MEKFKNYLLKKVGYFNFFYRKRMHKIGLNGTAILVVS